MARPGSEFSLGNQEELELDYYDYNVINAGAAPGSYLGMDPAYLVWIPPFDDVADTNDRDDDKTPEPQESLESETFYKQKTLPKYGHYLSPHSIATSSTNTSTSPTSAESSPPSSLQSKTTSPSDGNYKSSLLQQSFTLTAPSPSSSKPSTPYMTRKQRKKLKQQSLISQTEDKTECIPMNVMDSMETQETCLSDTLEINVMTGSYVEKETRVVKSPSDLKGFLHNFGDDIQFADEGDAETDIELVTPSLKDKMQQENSFESNRNIVIG